MVRKRTTVQLKSLNAIDTDNLILDEEQVKIPARLFTNRQDKLTFTKEELPVDLKELLDDLYLVRVQWSNLDSQKDELFQNFENDGLTINLVPGIANYEEIFDKFGEYLKFNLNINFNNKTLISTPTSALFHSNQLIKSSVIDNFLRKLVPNGLDRISFLTNFELIYENSQLIIQWISSPYDLLIDKTPKLRNEVALIKTKKLGVDLEVSGIRVVLDEEDSLPPTKTLFFVKNRHNKISDQLDIEFQEPIGLHPTLKISNFENLSDPPHSSCELFLLNMMNSQLFFDSYQYDKKKFTLIGAWGESNLEAPIWKVSKFGSVQLFQLNHEVLKSLNEFEIKFHSRYLKPSSNNEFEFITPEIFWACNAEEFIEDFIEFNSNPFNNYGLGYESFFEETTNFYHLNKNNRVLKFEIPTPDAKDVELVQNITFITLTIGLFYLITKFFKVNDDNDDNEKKNN